MTPYPSPEPPSEPVRSWKSTLKIIVPLVVLVGVVFGITFFSLYVPPKKDDPSGGTGPVGSGDEPPLRFFSSARMWEAPWEPATPEHPFNLLNRRFPGYFETGSHGKASFWFENPNASAVHLRLKAVSCSACSDGAVYIIPKETTRLTLQMAAVSALPQGMTTGMPFGMAGPGALFDLARLPPTAVHKFEDPTRVVFPIPAAGENDGWSPQWGILELGFTTQSSKSLKSIFTAELQSDPPKAVDMEFGIAFDVTPPFRVFPEVIDLGQISEANPPGANHELYVYSSTRAPAEFPAPTVVVFPGPSGEAAQFVTTGAPTAVNDDDLTKLSMVLSDRAKHPVKVMAAYRVPVTVNLKVGETRLDIGQLERQIQVTTLSADPKAVTVRATVRGGVWLSNGNAIDIGGFRSSSGGTFVDELVTDNPNAEVVVVEGQQKPDFLKVALEKQPNLGGKGFYKLRITIPPNKQVGLINDGLIVLEVKGPNPQRVRIPFRGRGEQ